MNFHIFYLIISISPVKDASQCSRKWFEGDSKWTQAKNEGLNVVNDMLKSTILVNLIEQKRQHLDDPHYQEF